MTLIASVQCYRCRTLVRLAQPTPMEDVPRGDDGRYVVPEHYCHVERSPASEPSAVDVGPSGRSYWTAPVAGRYHIGHGDPHLTSTCGDWCEPKPTTVSFKRSTMLSDDEMDELVERVGFGLRKGGWL